MSRDGERSEGEQLFGRLRRRGVLRSVGAGAAFSVGGYGLASQGDDEGTPEGDEGAEPVDRGCEPCIDAITGYHLLANAGDPTASLQADHLIEMRVADADVLFVDENEEMGAGEGAPGGDEAGTPTETPAEDNATDATEGEAAEGDGPPIPSQFPDFFFDPVGLLVRPGEVVEFRTMAPEIDAPIPIDHTVTAFHPRAHMPARVPDGVPGFSSGPVFVDESWLYRFDVEGVYDLLCIPHVRLGMVMRVVVLPEGSDAAPEAPPAPSAEEGVPDPVVQVFGAPELDPQNIVDQQQVAWTDLTGLSAEPPIGGGGGGGPGDEEEAAEGEGEQEQEGAADEGDGGDDGEGY